MTPQELKHTAHHGGDKMPNSGELRTLLSRSVDSFDNDEQEPSPHPVCVTNHLANIKAHGELIQKLLVIVSNLILFSKVQLPVLIW